ncbi:MAG: hypothetical protein DRG24_05960 [Epsilonproteobacteria bacterium]|nr:MAG: hypothetical protein DRG24_05960 [Campylobacterota bacterium]
MKLIEKALAFLQKKNRVQKEKIDKLKVIVKRLQEAEKEAKFRYKKETNRKKKKKNFKEYVILCKLFKKSQKRLKRLEGEVK